MVRSFLIAVVSTALMAAAAALPTSCDDPKPASTGPKIKVIFFSDDKCTQTAPTTIYTRDVFPGRCANDFPDLGYKSLIIDHIDDRFIGTNSGLQVGNTNNDTCDFTNSVTFSIGTKDNVGKCQFVGIPQKALGKPMLFGNEYRLTSLT